MMTSKAKPGDFDDWLGTVSDDPILSEQIRFVQRTPSHPAEFRELRTPVHPLISESLKAQGMSQLFSHQSLSYEAAERGEDIVIATGTNSGKSLCYNMPALQRILAEPKARALYLFPTKALARDQADKLEKFAPAHVVRIATYDGDTPPSQRSSIRKLAHVVMTNPDMLHTAMLPMHENWSTFYKSLRLIVLDEMHTYKGVFGSHVAGVIHRLLRLCAWHHSRPQIIACSATIANPEELFESLTGRRPTLIDRDGSPSGERTTVFWKPPDLPSGQALSANLVTGTLLASLTSAGVKTLAFSRSRVGAELVLRYAQRELEQAEVSPKIIDSYRAGYTVKERRSIETALFSGKLRGLSATNAMELGVDVGALSAVLMNGYPGSVASFQQQAGRAGRGSTDGLAIFVAHPDALENYLFRNPGELLARTAEAVTINPSNPQILSQQLTCAAHERALLPTDCMEFASNGLEVAESLDRSGILEFRAGRFYYSSHTPPAPGVNIRGGGGESVQLLVDGVEIGVMERWRAMTNAHEGAIYLHRGASFLVSELDLESNFAKLQPEQSDFYTQPIVQSVIEQKLVLRGRENGEWRASLAAISVTDAVLGFRKLRIAGGTMLGEEILELPPNSYDTLGVRFDFPEMDGPGVADLIGGMHAVEHALLVLAPLLAACDRGDLGSAWYTAMSDTLRPAVIIFDRVPGGVGLCERLFNDVDRWLTLALDLVRDCDCLNGCPSCLLSARCESNNQPLNKSQCLEYLELLQQVLSLEA